MKTYKELKKMFDDFISDKENISKNTFEQLLSEYPGKCLITSLRRCDNYYFDEGIVYLPNPAYDAYTLPEYDSEEKAFYATVIDMDNDFRREITFIVDLENLVDREKFQEIKEFYQIPEEDIKSVN